MKKHISDKVGFAGEDDIAYLQLGQRVKHREGLGTVVSYSFRLPPYPIGYDILIDDKLTKRGKPYIVYNCAIGQLEPLDGKFHHMFMVGE